MGKSTIFSKHKIIKGTWWTPSWKGPVYSMHEYERV